MILLTLTQEWLGRFIRELEATAPRHGPDPFAEAIRQLRELYRSLE